jgi:hypothetical protein
VVIERHDIMAANFTPYKPVGNSPEIEAFQTAYEGPNGEHIGEHTNGVRFSSLKSPKVLKGSMWGRVLGTIADITGVTISILILVFGFLVYRHEGEPDTPGSTVAKLVSISQYVSGASY